MKTLIYGMQSSGASFFAYWLSQQEKCLSVIDLHYNYLSPVLNHDNIIIKCVCTKEISIKDHISEFKPDRVIFFIRNPIENYLSLSEKIYANYGGTIEEKLALMDDSISNVKYDFLVKYEDFLWKKLPVGLGDSSYFNFNKTLDQIKEYNFIHSDWCLNNYKKKWGLGNIHAHQKILDIFRNRTNLTNFSKIYQSKEQE